MCDLRINNALRCPGFIPESAVSGSHHSKARSSVRWGITLPTLLSSSFWGKCGRNRLEMSNDRRVFKLSSKYPQTSQKCPQKVLKLPPESSEGPQYE